MSSILKLPLGMRSTYEYDSLASVLSRSRMSKPYWSPTPRTKLMQQKTTNPPPPRTQKGAKTLSNPHQCPILPWGGGGWGFQLAGALFLTFRPVARKILQPRHYFKKCARIEFYKLLALYHEDSKVVVWHCRWIQNEECVDSFTYFSLLHCWGGLRLNLLTTYAKKTNKQTKKKRGNFNRGECLGLPHTGYGPDVTGKTWTTAVANTWLWPSTLRGTIKEFR